MAVVEGISNYDLAIAVRVEIYRTCWNDTDKRWSESFEECAWGFVSIDIAVRISIRKRGGGE